MWDVEAYVALISFGETQKLLCGAEAYFAPPKLRLDVLFPVKRRQPHEA
jgi:hypothetical protein